MNSKEFYQQLVQAQYSALYLYAMSILHDSYLAEDLVMDTFHTAFVRIEVVQGHENPKGAEEKVKAALNAICNRT